MKKIIVYICLSAFMLTILSACGAESVTLLDFLPANELGGTLPDFGGAEIVCTSNWSPFYKAPENTSLEADRTRYRVAQVEKALNVDIVTDLGYFTEDSSYYISLYLADNMKYDMTVQLGSPNPVYNMYKAGILEPLEYMSAIDLSNTEIYGTPEMRRAVTFKGLTYAFNADNGDDGGNRGFLAYNDYLVKTFGVSDPQELYEQGLWTFDTFEEILPLVSDMSDPSNKIYGLTVYCDYQMLPFSAIFANGGKVVKQDENGKYVFALDDSEAIEALQWVTNLHQTSDIYQESWPPHLFEEGKATFYLGRTFSIQHALLEEYNVDEYYYIPFPCGPSGEYGVSSGTYSSDQGGVAFFSSSDTEMVGYVFDYFLRFDDYPESLVLDEYQHELTSKFWSEESYSHYLRGFEIQEYDYFYEIGSDLYGKLAKGLYDSTVGNTNLSKVFDSYKNAIQMALDDSLNS